MDNILNLDPVSLGVVGVRTTIIYLTLLILLRAAGKRELGQLTPFDLVVLLVISNAVQNAMVGPDTSLTAGIVAAATLVFVNYLVNRAAGRFTWIRGRVFGAPTVLVSRGELIMENLRRERVTVDEVLQALREHGVANVAHTRLAVLEVDGTISVIPTDQDGQHTRRRVRGRKPTG